MNDISTKIAFQEKVYETLHNLISSSDNKATLALTIQTFLLGSIIGTSIITDIIEKNICVNFLFIDISLKSLIILFGISSMVGIGISILVLYPRKPKEKNESTRQGLTYYLHISNYESSTEYSTKLKNLNNEDILEEYNRQNFNLAHIVKKKMLLVRIVFILILLNIAQSIIIIFLI
ncbi:MAG: hypothetical protein IPM14_07530 [bacterium]|nr:hypothetical protein [bacterium]